MPQVAWHSLAVEDVLQRLESSPDGLGQAEAQTRLDRQGPNRLPEAKGRSLLRMLLAQFSDFMIIILLLAALISGLIGELQDTIAILVIILLNAIIGVVQEFRAERALAALRQMAAPEASVIREGRLLSLAATELVAGDVVELEAGNIVPADLRLFEVEQLQADESTLTGESSPVEKHSDRLDQADLPPGDRFNLAYRNSLITRGRGRGVVVATGVDTEMGRIAQLLQTEEKVKTPLQLQLARFGRNLALAVLVISAIVFGAGLLQGQPLLLMFLTAISLAVAAIPEALPAVVTISLALGARMLIRHNALVRNLPAVETLGSVTYICADKTGTLTQNRMTAELIYVAGKRQPMSLEAYSELGHALALNNDIVEKNGKPAGEPTELALFQASRDAGFDKAALLKTRPRVGVIPFDSDRKQMTTLHKTDQGVVAYCKGAPERVLMQCTREMGQQGKIDTGIDVEALLAEALSLANEGYRVLALASRQLPALPETVDTESVERELTLLGLVALIDPPRDEAPQAVADCLTAGITPVMITGDHPGTALAIATRLGIAQDAAEMLSGEQLSALSEAEFAERVRKLRVYARVSPEQKLRIVKALQAQGEFVAMTGDGVNDAPALKRAGIGLAMGIGGTDVAREAADMVLLDDDFSSIVRAVRAGRRIFDNIRKFISYTMSSNSGEIWTLFLAPFLGLPIPLLPIHILWINLVTDGLPGLALTTEKTEPGIMQRPPRKRDQSIFSQGMWQHILWVGLLLGGVSLAAMAWAISRQAAHWQTMVFTVLTISQLFNAFAVRSESASLFKIGLFSNLPMLGAVLLTLLLQMAVIYLPALNRIFHTQPLPALDLAVCLALSSLVLFAVEFEKLLIRRGIIYSDK